MELAKRDDVPVELTWDLSLIYPTEEAMLADAQKMKELSLSMEASYKGNLTDAATINHCLDDYQEVYRLITLTANYCDLAVSVDYYNSAAEDVAACRAKAEEAFSKLNGSADPAHDFAVLAATYSDETDRDQHPSGYTFTVGDGTLPAACEETAQALEEGQFSGVVEADDGFYLILRKPVDLEAVAPDYFDALLQAAADSADISTTRTYADLDVSRFYDELIAARAELDASGGEVA